MKFIRKTTMEIYSAYSIFRLAEASAIKHREQEADGTASYQADDPSELKLDAFQTFLDQIVEKVKRDLFGENSEQLLKQFRSEFKEKNNGKEENQKES